MNLSLYFLIMDIFTIAGTPRRGIIIATSSTQFLPNQINSLLKILNRPFCYEFKIEFSSIWQRKLSQSHIRGKKLILLTILFYGIHHSMMISTNYVKKLVYSCIRAVRYKPRRPTEDELKLKSQDIP